jgi:predicted RecB family nuclease
LCRRPDWIRVNLATLRLASSRVQRFDDRLILSASDLTGYLECDHLTEQQLAIARAERGRPRRRHDPHTELMQQRGEAFETEQFKEFAAAAGGCVDLSSSAVFDEDALRLAAEATVAAMRDGAPLIYQGALYDGRWQGRPDFLRRVAIPSNLGDWSYEVLDTKLSRELKPAYVNQVLLYSRMVGEIQTRALDDAWLVLGNRRHEQIDLRRFRALHRHLARRLQTITNGPPRATYPEPVAFCANCSFGDECDARRRADDHLSLVSGAGRPRREALIAGHISTRRGLAASAQAASVPGLRRETFATLRNQAALQVLSEDERRPVHRHLEPRRAEGYAALPDPDAGDIFFDLEGDPFIGEAGIEYLWGWSDAHDHYERCWAHTPAEEKQALEGFVDRVLARRQAFPGMHVYHYAPHERAKLRSLAMQYATREAEVDVLLRGEVFVDLFAVVRTALQVGEESYSLKRLERHHGFERHEHTVREGGGSIVAYEGWLSTGDEALLEAIRAYNAEDCTSTRSLRDWLVDQMTPEATEEFKVDFTALRTPEPEEQRDPPDWLPDVERRVTALMAGLEADAESDHAEQAERRLLAHLLLYHYREDKPKWWRYFDLRATPAEELFDDLDAIVGLEPDHAEPPQPAGKSLLYRFTFPPQEHRVSAGHAEDPLTGDDYTIDSIAIDHLYLKRAKDRPAPAPSALVEDRYVGVTVLRDALVDLADRVLSGTGSTSADRRLLRGEPPMLASGALGSSTDELVAAALALRRSVLPVQGPPGTGKTYNGARMIVAALNAGRRVGVTAPSHAAIQNLLREVDTVATKCGVQFQGVYNTGGGPQWEGDQIEGVTAHDAVTDDHRLVAGTAWLFARDQHRDAFRLLFIDEAGQYSLANAAAVARAAESLILLGDPQQLPQVTQAPHPLGAGASVLEHLLRGADTIPANRGVLLAESWRMHPKVCEFVSERSYEGKLHSRADCGKRRIEAPALHLEGAGLRTLVVEHHGRSQSSPEEAAAIADACRALLSGGTVTDEHGSTRTLEPDDILVLAPYNHAVKNISELVPDGVQVGTVDRFQGQQAPLVFYAMTCSSGAEAPRGIDFLFSRNRFNVAISRAQALAILVYNPALLDSACPSVEVMALLDGVCRFAEMAEPLTNRGLAVA